MKIHEAAVLAYALIFSACLRSPEEIGTTALALECEEEGDGGECEEPEPYRDCEEDDIRQNGCATLLCINGWFQMTVRDDDLCDDGFFCTVNECDPGSPEADWKGCTIRYDHGRCSDDGIACTSDGCEPFDSQDASGCYHRPEDSVCGDAPGPCLRPTCSPTHGCEILPDTRLADAQLDRMNDHVQAFYDTYSTELAAHTGTLGHNGPSSSGQACQGPDTCGGFGTPHSTLCSYGKSCVDVNSDVLQKLVEMLVRFNAEPGGSCWMPCAIDTAWRFDGEGCFNHAIAKCTLRHPSGPGSVRFWDHWNGAGVKAAPIGAFWVRYPFATESECVTQL